MKKEIIFKNPEGFVTGRQWIISSSEWGRFTIRNMGIIHDDGD